MNRVSLDWKTIEKDCKDLAHQINFCDVILAVGRGGFVPSVLLSHHLDCTVVNFGLKSYKDKQAGDIVVTQPPGLLFNSNYREKKVVVVDDLSDKGQTLQYIKEYLDGHDFHLYRFATLYIKNSTKFVPTYFVKEFDENIWLDFPWETVKLD